MTYEMKILEREREAWAKSREIALAEGSHARNIEIAKQMLQNNMSKSDIHMYTSLSLNEIEALQEN